MLKMFILSKNNHFMRNNNYYLKSLKSFDQNLKKIIKENFNLPNYISNNIFYISNHKKRLNLTNNKLDMCAQNIMKIINTFNSNNIYLKTILHYKLIKSRISNKNKDSYNIPIDQLLNKDPINNISYFYNNSLKKFKYKLGGTFKINNNKLKFFFDNYKYNLISNNLQSTQLFENSINIFDNYNNIQNPKLYSNLINIRKRISDIHLSKLENQKEQGDFLNIPNNIITNNGINTNRLTNFQYS